MNKMEVEHDPFPAHLALDEQGIFVLGYYHQRQAFYIPKNRVQAALEMESMTLSDEKEGD
jgi:hypothetical protein